MNASLVLLAMLVPALMPAESGQALAPGQIRTLELGNPIERELGGGLAHEYGVRLEAGQYLQLAVDQRGIDVVVSLSWPDGSPMIEINRSTGKQGPEPLTAIADRSGTHRLKVASPDKDAPTGIYAITIEVIRAATESDRHRAAADFSVARADRLLSDGSAAALNRALELYQEALSHFRAIQDRRREAETLNGVGLTVFSLGEYPKAIGFYEEALRIHKDLGDSKGEAKSLSGIGVAYRFLGENQRAIGYFDQALPITQAAGDLGGEASTLSNIGDVLQALGENQKALGNYMRALPLCRAAGDRKCEAQTLSSMGDAYQTLGEGEKALESFRQALPSCRAAGDIRCEASTLNSLGLVSWQAGRNEEALGHFLQALSLNRKAGDRQGEAAQLNNMGLVYSDLGEIRKAFDRFQESLEVVRALGERMGEALVLNSMGVALEKTADFKKAIAVFEQALPIHRSVGNREGEAATLTNIGSAYSSIGEYRKALEYHQQALAVYRAIAARRGEGMTLNNVGTVYSDLGEQQKALESYQQALPIHRAAGNPRGEAITLVNIGEVYSELGENKKALEYFQQALKGNQSTGDRYNEAGTLDKMGAIYRNRGERPKAFECYQKALEIHRAIGDRRGEAETLAGIGTAHRDAGESEKALERYLEALPIQKNVEDRKGESSAELNIGLVHAGLGEHQEAEKHFEQSLAIARRISDPVMQLKSLHELAVVRRRQGLLSRASEDIESAMALLESLRSHIYDPELRSSFQATLPNLFRTHAEILLALHQRDPAGAGERLALEAIERGRGRALLEMLREAKADIRSGADPALLEQEKSIGGQLDAKLDRLMRLLGGKHSVGQVAAIREQIGGLETEYQQVRATIRARSPRYAALTQPLPLQATQIQKQILDHDTLLLEYALGRERSWLFLVTPQVVRSYELVGEEQIERAARRLYETLTARNLRIKGESDSARRERLLKTESGYQDAARTLSDLVLGPASSWLPGKRIVLVADGVLQYVPFEALPEPGVKEFIPLIVGHEVVNLPSASVLAEVRRETATRKTASREVAILADPVFDAADARVARPALKETAPDAALDRAALDVGAGTDELRLPRLVFTRQEAEAISALCGKARSMKALDFEANLDRVRSGDLSGYRFVHFATHGLLNTERPALSGLVLSLVDRTGKPREGFLKLKDIYDLNLPADLVVLSACQTGLGKEIRGEGLIGLARGFLYAGAKQLVASLWKVDDVATAELMKRFYRGMLVEKQRPAAALRRAQLSMWKERRWESPYYWAAFTLQGDWR